MFNFFYRYLGCFLVSLIFKIIIKRTSGYDSFKLNIITFIPLVFTLIVVVYVFFIFNGTFVNLIGIADFNLKIFI
jgi:hypothetical protein